MLLHVDPETLRRHPLLGVAIGAVAFVVMGLLFQAQWRVRSALHARSEPLRVEASQLPSIGPDDALWVEIHGGVWLCDDAFELESQTEVPVVDPSGTIFVIAFYDRRGVDCVQEASEPLTGVAVSANDVRLANGIPGRFASRFDGTLAFVVRTDAEPGSADWEAAGFALLTAIGLGMMVVFGRLWLRQRHQRESTPFPIAPD